MKTVITGGSGFIGQFVVERLLAAGDEVTTLDLVPPPAGGARPTRYVRGDVRDPGAVRESVAGADRVLHLAAAHHDFGIDERTYFDVNAGAARVLCDAMTLEGIRDVCFFSSCAVYGDAPEPHDEREDTPLRPNSPYGASKLEGEGVFARWARDGDTALDRRVLVIRPTVVFGPRNFGNMYSLIQQVFRRRYLPVGDGRNQKSLAYVDNLVDALLFLWERPDRPAFDVYNYVDKPDLTSHEIASAIYEALGRSTPSVTVPLGVALALGTPFDLVIRLTGRNLPVSTARIRKMAEARTVFEASKVRAAGFSPRVSLREGIRHMVDWYVREGRRQPVARHLPPAQPALSDLAVSR